MSSVGEFYDAALKLWDQYQQTGPNSLSAEWLEALELARRQIRPIENELDGDVLKAIDSILDLSRRCVLRPEGLSFVTGEAGLIPRQDLHRRFDDTLAVLGRIENHF